MNPDICISVCYRNLGELSAIGNFQCEKSNSAVAQAVSVFLSNSRHSRVILLISQLLSVGSMKHCLWAMGH